MNNLDERIALTSILVAEKHDLSAWTEIRFDEPTNKYVVVLTSQYKGQIEEEVTFQLNTLEELAVLWTTAEEYDRIYKATGADPEWSPSGAEVLMDATVARLHKTDKHLPNGFISYKNWTAPTAEDLPVLSDLIQETGQFVLQAIKVASAFEDWFGFITYHIVDSKFDHKAGWWVSVEPKLAIQLPANSTFRFGCSDDIILTPENLPELKETISEVLFRLPETDDDNEDRDPEHWARVIFACRQHPEKMLQSWESDRIPAELMDLFETLPSYINRNNL